MRRQECEVVTEYRNHRRRKCGKSQEKRCAANENICNIHSYNACGIGTIKEQKIRDVPYSIVRKDEVPEELKQEIETSKKTEMWLSYAEREKGQGDLYIVRGYGRQETPGYSIKVNSFYETENTLVMRTTLLGPEKEKHKKQTYPYIVIKTAYTEKQIIYE